MKCEMKILKLPLCNFPIKMKFYTCTADLLSRDWLMAVCLFRTT
jgi:hypothetical protein